MRFDSVNSEIVGEWMWDSRANGAEQVVLGDLMVCAIVRRVCIKLLLWARGIHKNCKS